MGARTPNEVRDAWQRCLLRLVPDRGSVIAEYALLLAIIALGTTMVILALGSTVGDMFVEPTEAMNASTQSP